MSAMRLNRRRIVTLAVALALGALLVWAYMPMATRNNTLAGEPALAASRDWLRNASTSDCYQQAIVEYAVPLLTKYVDNLPAGDQWMDGGTRGYVGADLSIGAASMKSGAVAASIKEAYFGGQDGDHYFIKAIDQQGPAIFTYEKITTPKGRIVWVKINEERPDNAAACQG